MIFSPLSFCKINLLRSVSRCLDHSRFTFFPSLSLRCCLLSLRRFLLLHEPFEREREAARTLLSPPVMPLFGKKKSAVDDGADKAIVAGGIDTVVDAEVFSMRGREAASVVRFVPFSRARDREMAPVLSPATEEARERKATNRESPQTAAKEFQCSTFAKNPDLL